MVINPVLLSMFFESKNGKRQKLQTIGGIFCKFPNKMCSDFDDNNNSEQNSIIQLANIMGNRNL